MGTQERKRRDMAEREQRFLAAARDQICEEGLLSLQMAKVARACDYATGTLYQHFASKEDLLCAVCTSMSQERVEKFMKVAQWQAGSRDRMFAIAVADMLFARDNPTHFSLNQYVVTEVVWNAASQSRRDDLMDSNRPLGELVREVVEQGIRDGDVDAHGNNALELSIGQWSLTTGMHNLVHAQGVLEMYELHQPYRLMLQQINALLNGLNWQPLVDPFDETALKNQIERIRAELFPEICQEQN